MRPLSPRQAPPYGTAEWHLAKTPGYVRRRDVTMRVDIFLAEKRLDEALALVESNVVCATRSRQKLAMSLEPSQAAAALRLLLIVFADVMRGSSSPYQDPLQLVGDITHRMSPEQRARWLTELRQTYRAKRNFMSGLPAA